MYWGVFVSLSPLHLAGTDGPTIRLSVVISALSRALDLVEGQPQGHAIRSCMIGLRLAQTLKLPEADRETLFYALLMKDLGCSSNAARMCFLFQADDRQTKGAIKSVDWRDKVSSAAFAMKHVAPGQSLMKRMAQAMNLAVTGQRAGKELVQIRCERGAQIARQLDLGEEVATAIQCLDEHFDGGGHPQGLAGESIPLVARVMCLAQTAEVFQREKGLDAMRTMARDRRGTWFDPALVDALLSLRADDELFRHLTGDIRAELLRYAPRDRELFADEDRLDRIAFGFAQVIDAKSPWTFRHSLGVADIAEGIAETLGFRPDRVRTLKRAALMHDIGKLGVSNLILDKPGKLDANELAVMRKHTGHTFDILSEVDGFRDLAELAASHHERLDGQGYHRGLTGDHLSADARVLCVADMYEALAAKRPYRQDLTEGEVMSILNKSAAARAICPQVLDALKTFIAKTSFEPHQLVA
jgi:putative nucleotidyltransferase with HDIG domain